jgi:hypothetical protein
MDLATANAYTNNVSVLLNNDDGSFSSAGSYQVGYGPYSITASDLDGDGDADLATANNDSNNVSVLLNNDDGTFADAGNYEAGIGAFSITAADLDGDSDADLAAANASSNDISVLVNNGDGTFDGDVNYPVGDQPYSITATDLDGDGDVDLANANRASDNVSVLVNNDDATFADAVNYPVEGGPDSITASDLDSDDDMDLATANGDSSTISVLFNNGEGTFDGDESYAVEDQLHSVTAADLNGDDDADLATAGVFSNNVSLLVNNGGGTFSDAVDYPVGDWPNSITNADLDGDGDMDLATANSGSSNVSVLLNKDEGNQGSSEGNNGEPGTGEDTSSPNDSEEASLDQTVEDYYLAAGAEDWEYTYDNLDSQTQSMFTDEEWSRKNQWFWDSNPTVYHILSIESDGYSEGSVAEVEVRITGEDGSSWTRTTYFVKEDGGWKHRFSEEETDLFMPDATFEEFVEAQTDASSEDTPEPVADGVCEPLPGESQDPDCPDDQQEKESGLLRFDGSWRVHGVQMNIVSDATSSQIANVGPCTDPFEPGGSEAMCNQVRLIEFSEALSGGIVGTITEIRYETWEGDPPPPGFEPGSDLEVGDSFKLEFVDDNLLRTTWLDGAAHLNGQGNPYWCNSQTSEENIPKCGA